MSSDSRFVRYLTVDFYLVAVLTKNKSFIYPSYIVSASMRWYLTHTNSFTAQDFPT